MNLFIDRNKKANEEVHLIENLSSIPLHLPPPPPPPPPASNSTAKSVDAVVVPPDDLKIVIDKLADYVSRNGTEFEQCIRQKNDPRFTFLDPTHPNHSYYQFKVKELAVSFYSILFKI